MSHCKQFKMTPRFTFIEKTISLLLIIWGGVFLYFVILGAYYVFNAGFKDGNISWQTISFARIIKNYHLQILLPLATSLAGLLLLFNKKIGWTCALITLLLNSFLFLIPADRTSRALQTQDTEFLFSIILVILVFLGLFFATFVGQVHFGFEEYNKE